MIKALEIETSILFNINLANNTILSYLYFFYLIIDLYFLILAAIAHIFNRIAKLAVLIGIPSKEAKAEIEIYPVIGKDKIKVVQYDLELYKPFYAFYSSIHFAIFLQGNNFLFHLYI